MGVTAETGAGLSIVNASYRIGGTTILDKVSVDVRCGRVLVLVGPNGAGKSTLLGMLAGDADPTGGDVLLHGRAARPVASQGAGASPRRAPAIEPARLPVHRATGHRDGAGAVDRHGRVGR